MYRNRVLQSLVEADRIALQPQMRKVMLRPGEELIRENTMVEVMHFPETAILTNVVSVQDGHMVETSTLGFESVSGLIPCLAHVPAAWRTVVQTGGDAFAIAASTLQRQALRSPPLLDLLLRLTHDAQAHSAQLTVCNTLHPLMQRLVRWLLVIDDRTQGSKLHVTQDEIARALGVQRTTVNASARVLSEMGAISYLRAAIEIRDRAALERLACECYGAIRRRSDSLDLMAPKENSRSS